MYLRYYGLEKKPFDITPDPEFLFLSDSHKEALAAIVYGVENRKGFIVITGEVGLGKTTVVRSYLKQFSSEKLEIVFIFNTKVTFQELMISIYDDLELPLNAEDQFQLVLGFQNYLIDNYKKGSNLVLIIDEAQHLPVETLEALRMLSNLETAKEKLLQVILIGQPELSNLLDLSELRQLKQRIAVQTALSPLTRQESLGYISHRIQKAGGNIDQLFTKGALKRIVAYAEGIPRKIQILCDNALVAGLGYQKKPATAKIVNEAIGDMEGMSAKKPKFIRKAVFAAAVLLLFSAGAFYFFFASNFFPEGKSIVGPVAGSLNSSEKKLSTSLTPPTENHIRPRKFPDISRTPSKAVISPSKKETRIDSMASGNKASDQPVPEKKTTSSTAATGEISPKAAKAASTKPEQKAAKTASATPEPKTTKAASATPETKTTKAASATPETKTTKAASATPETKTTKAASATPETKTTKAASATPETKTTKAASATPETKTTKAASATPETKTTKAASATPETKTTKAASATPETKTTKAASATPETKTTKAASATPETKTTKAASATPETKTTKAASATPETKTTKAASATPETKAEVPQPSAETAAPASAVISPKTAKPVAAEKKPIDEKKSPKQEEKIKVSSTDSTGKPKGSDKKPSQATPPSAKIEDKKNSSLDAGIESEEEDTPRPSAEEPDAMDLMDWVLKNR